MDGIADVSRRGLHPSVHRMEGLGNGLPASRRRFRLLIGMFVTDRTAPVHRGSNPSVKNAFNDALANLSLWSQSCWSTEQGA
jgi:hypothetical protein